MVPVTTDVLFRVGQIVHHLRYGYRGVVVGYDHTCQADEDWYTFQVQGKGYEPDKSQPWYQVLVDGSSNQTYVAQQNLEPGASGRPIEHPLVSHFFVEFRNGCYHEPTWN
jgi:heat shock protein HspQ